MTRKQRRRKTWKVSNESGAAKTRVALSQDLNASFSRRLLRFWRARSTRVALHLQSGAAKTWVVFSQDLNASFSRPLVGSTRVAIHLQLPGTVQPVYLLGGEAGCGLAV